MIELEEQISGAFAGEEEGYWEGEEPAVVTELLDVSPWPVQVSVVELEEEVERHRRVVVREGRGISVELILVIAGSLFFHAIFVCLFIWAIFFHKPIVTHGLGMSSGDSDAGGSGAGYMIMGDGAKGDPVRAGRIPDVVLPSITLKAPPISPVLPPETPPVLPAKSPQMVSKTPPKIVKVEVVDPIGIPPVADPLGTIKLAAVAPRNLPSVPETPVVNPPEQVAMVSPPSPVAEILPKVEQAPSAGGKTGAVAHSPRGGIGEGGDANDDEPVIDITKPGTGGEGFGSGGGQGNGIDRGGSGADGPAIPLNLYVPPKFGPLEGPTANAVVQVVVLANGRAGKVTLLQSCGFPSVDEALVQFEKKEQRFRPARQAGAAVEAEWTYTVEFIKEKGK